jgi:hypothetical protein
MRIQGQEDGGGRMQRIKNVVCIGILSSEIKNRKSLEQ